MKIAGRIIWRLVFLAIFGGILYAIGLVNWSEVEKSFRIDRADVRVEVQDDGSLHVTEQLTYDFTGNFSGAFRDIPLAAGVTARNVRGERGGGGLRAGRRDRLGLVRPAGDLRRRAAHNHGAGRRADEGLPRRVALRGGFRGARLSARLRRHGSCRGLRRRDLRAVGGVGEPVGVLRSTTFTRRSRLRMATSSPRAPGFARGGWA